jgi:nucleotide-binding universal stress UspA family protein
MAPVRRILFASDFSKASGKAFAFALTLAKAHRATLTILHVIVPGCDDDARRGEAGARR